MKTITSRILALSSAAVLTTLGASGQTADALAPSKNAPKSPEARVSQAAKEKAEDDAFLQQLDSADQQPRIERRGKTVRGTGGGAIGGIAPMGLPGLRAQNLITRSSSAVQTLVIKTSDPDPKTQSALEEDLAVMSHLLNKAVEELPGGQPNGNRVMGIDVFFAPGGTPSRSLYLDGYGAVFFLGVNFPLVSPPEKPVEERAAGGSAWEEARRDLYGQKLAGTFVGETSEDYSQEKVDRLKDTLLEAIKNATNIRGLHANEFVTIWVCGGSSVASSRTRLFKNNPPGTLGGNFVAVDQSPVAPRRTVLTIQATKGEIDSYASGKMPPEEFQKHARITTYTGDTLGGAANYFTVGGIGGHPGF